VAPGWGISRRRRQFGRIVAAIRRRRGRPRSLQELRELSDHLLSGHLLRDIGLTREKVGYEFPTPFSHCD
jgi:uncharacterized protein YjiS (DUF1127 family)